LTVPAFVFRLVGKGKRSIVKQCLSKNIAPKHPAELIFASRTRQLLWESEAGDGPAEAQET
jgi:6-phosphogluconolactonase/glucosamine-6-phosphate isomerase/deaminase